MNNGITYRSATQQCLISNMLPGQKKLLHPEIKRHRYY